MREFTSAEAQTRQRTLYEAKLGDVVLQATTPKAGAFLMDQAESWARQRLEFEKASQRFLADVGELWEQQEERVPLLRDIIAKAIVRPDGIGLTELKSLRPNDWNFLSFSVGDAIRELMQLGALEQIGDSPEASFQPTQICLMTFLEHRNEAELAMHLESRAHHFDPDFTLERVWAFVLDPSILDTQPLTVADIDIPK